MITRLLTRFFDNTICLLILTITLLAGYAYLHTYLVGEQGIKEYQTHAKTKEQIIFENKRRFVDNWLREMERIEKYNNSREGIIDRIAREL